jgi:prevent-host-death family protein
MMYMKYREHVHDWTVAEARRSFSELLRAASREPQRIFNRSSLVAAVVDAGDYEEFQRWRKARRERSLAEDFEELREICREEQYALPVAKRSSRRTPFEP